MPTSVQVIVEQRLSDAISRTDLIPANWPAAHTSCSNVNEDNFDDCFRYWEIRRFGGDYKDPPSLLNSKTPSSESK